MLYMGSCGRDKSGPYGGRRKRGPYGGRRKRGPYGGRRKRGPYHFTDHVTAWYLEEFE
jgi:hypothetical protein